MSWENQKEWYLQIKTVFILGWGKQTIKVWRHSEILGVEIYWPKVDDSAILSLRDPFGPKVLATSWNHNFFNFEPIRKVWERNICTSGASSPKKKWANSAENWPSYEVPKFRISFCHRTGWSPCIPPNRQLWSDVLTKPKGMIPSN